MAGTINPGPVLNLIHDDVVEAYAALDERRAMKSLLRVSEIDAERAQSSSASALGPARDRPTGSLPTSTRGSC